MSQFRQSKSRVKGGWNEGGPVQKTKPKSTEQVSNRQEVWPGLNPVDSNHPMAPSSISPPLVSAPSLLASASLVSAPSSLVSAPVSASAHVLASTPSVSSASSTTLASALSVPRSLSSSSPSVEVYGPGLVLLRQFLSPEMQLYLVKECFAKQHSDLHSGTFWSSETLASGRPLFHLNMGTRGRMIDRIDAFPTQFKDICLQSLVAAQKVDSSLPSMSPTTLLINFYKPKATFKWHQDSEDPERRKQGCGHPIVSFSIGLAADFGFKYRYTDPHRTMRLLSGDVLVFGGASRMIVHSVLGVIPDSLPGYLQGHLRVGRLNLTFRDTIGGTIDATEFPRYRVLYQNENSGPSMDDG